jgi:preprotein translocase subunit YajC
MKTFITTLGISLLLSTVATSSIAQQHTGEEKKKQRPSVGAGEAVVIQATVQSVDRAKREVTLKKEDGTVATIKVPERARNFDQIKAGDVVTAAYTESVAVAVRKSDEPPSATGRESVERSAPGQKPGIEKTSTVQMSATIEKIDRDKRQLTLKGPEGKTRTVKVPEDMKRFDELKEGDQVVVTATESIAIEVTKPQQ